jgi:hypothetical protein
MCENGDFFDILSEPVQLQTHWTFRTIWSSGIDDLEKFKTMWRRELVMNWWR